MKLLHDGSNFDIPKIYASRTHFLDAFVLSVAHTNTRQDTRQ